ncbi:hypothetical protein ACFL1A_03295 [Patescibacteria group bacterium]
MNKLLADLSIDGITVSDPVGFAFRGAPLGTVVTEAIKYIIAAAGVGLLLMILSAGFSMLTAAGDSKKMESGKQRLTYAVIGFVIIISAAWITQIAGTIFGIQSIIEIFGG